MRTLTALLVLLVACVSPGDATVAGVGPSRAAVAPDASGTAVPEASHQAARPYRPTATRPPIPEPVAPVRVVTVPTSRPRALVTGGHATRKVKGVASRMGSGFGRSYLALPEGKGRLVIICGAKDCWKMTSTDAGPALFMQRAGRVADLNDWVWAKVSGLPLSRGLAKITVFYL